MSFLINSYRFAGSYDTDAQTYITAVETADGQALETAVKNAINAFVVGCKVDGIWSAIKASCILAGARTLSGALVPLVGAAPTNNNFVSGDYNRKTGLLGDGSTKYINSNRNHAADPQDSYHLSAYATSLGTAGNSTTPAFYMGYSDFAGTNTSSLGRYTALFYGRLRENNSTLVTEGTGLLAASRSNGTSLSLRANGTGTTVNSSSQLPASGNLFVLARNSNGSAAQFSTARVAFYSIGESLSLSLLDSRVTTLINAIAAAIP